MREEKKNRSYELRREAERQRKQQERASMSRQGKKELKQREKKEKKKKREVNKEFARVTYAFVALFLVLMAYIGYFNIVESKDIISSPYNPRLDSMADRVVRGSILDKDGNVLASTETAEDGSEYRSYPYGSLYAHVVGYDSQGKSGLESTENFELLTSNAFFLEKLRNEFQDEKNIGDTVVTTLDTSLQQAAYNALGDNKGAVVILEPTTGKILTMLSKPDFDPNTVEQDWDALNSDPDSSLLNRALQGQYAPGSTFKIVTALEYMREHADYESYTYTCSGSITYDGVTIPCAGGNVHGTVSLADSFAYSCNSSFCNIGLSLDISGYQDTAGDLLFNKALPGNDISPARSSFSLGGNASSSDRMMTAMGQGETQVSPYHMALITSAIANGGNLMRPYLVEQVTNYTGSIVREASPESYGSLMTSQEAAQLKAYMQDVTDYGTGSVFAGSGYSVAGKTGTAEYADGDSSRNHSWFVGFTDVDNPELAICVIVEQSDGGTRAVDVAKEILDSYYYNQ